MNSSKISVIVPVYNVEKFLESCVNSILSQTFKEFECILVDDGSTDSSGKICDELSKKDKRIKVIHKENGGLSDARNAGIKVADSPYIMFVDSDDTISDDLLFDAYNKMTANDNIDLYITGLIMNRYNGDNIVSSVDYSVTETLECNLSQLLDMWYDPIPLCVFFAAYCKLFKTDIIRKNNLSFCTDVVVCEDMEFIGRYLNCCSKNGNCISLSEGGRYFYKKMSGTISTTFHIEYEKNQTIIMDSLTTWVNGISPSKEAKQMFNEFVHAGWGATIHYYYADVSHTTNKERIAILKRVVNDKTFRAVPLSAIKDKKQKGIKILCMLKAVHLLNIFYYLKRKTYKP